MVSLCCHLSCCISTKFGQHFPLFLGILMICLCHDQVRTQNWILYYWYQPSLSPTTFSTKFRLSAEISRNLASASPVILPFRNLHWPETALSPYRVAFYRLLRKLLDVFPHFLEPFGSNSVLLQQHLHAITHCYMGAAVLPHIHVSFPSAVKSVLFPAFYQRSAAVHVNLTGLWCGDTQSVAIC